MKMIAVKLHHHYMTLLAALVLFCPVAWSEDMFESPMHYGIDEGDFNRMKILPTYMMDTDTLFRAAEADRDGSMTRTQRLLNNRWLFENGTPDHSGGEALRKYLRMYFLTNWKTGDEQPANTYSDYLPVTKKQDSSQFKDLSNYHLRVSDDKVRLKFKYQFD